MEAERGEFRRVGERSEQSLSHDQKGEEEESRESHLEQISKLDRVVEYAPIVTVLG